MALPKHCNLTITINNQDITCNHNSFSRLTLDRVVSDAANKFELSVLDDTAFDLEKILIMGNNDISISYLDELNKVKYRFEGNITKISSSFINNRNMLTLEGYVGLSISDKYELINRNWNQVPVFKFEDIFDNWDTDESDITATKDLGDKIVDFITSIFCSKTYNDSAVIEHIDSILNNIYQDENGKFYTFSQKTKDQGKDVPVEAEMWQIPIKPHEILKLICNGGNLSSLFRLGSDSYVERLSDVDKAAIKPFLNKLANTKHPESVSLYISKFLEKIHISGTGWNYNEANVTPTRYVDADFSQSGQSNVRYIYDVLCSKALTNDENIIYNYVFNLDNNKNVTFKPLNIDANEKPKRTFTYYGNFANQTETEDAHLISFAADTNILTAYLTGDESVLSTLSNLNLVTNESMSSSLLTNETESTLVKEAEYKYDYKEKVMTPAIIGSGSSGKTVSWQKYWASAMSQTYKATASIAGNSGLSPGDIVDIIVIPRPGLYHHSSGTYYIIKMKDTIENGKIISELELVKNHATLGKSTLKSASNTSNKISNSGGGGGSSW